MAAKRAIMAMTTSSSINVNARKREWAVFIHRPLTSVFAFGLCLSSFINARKREWVVFAHHPLISVFYLDLITAQSNDRTRTRSFYLLWLCNCCWRRFQEW